ncbi:MAG: metal ABC transporter substrate-binding protein, partial [Chloroflexota bacterium]|nr:metal ABC transporter substrate-binding protein [Chloroflexota bacterium]
MKTLVALTAALLLLVPMSVAAADDAIPETSVVVTTEVLGSVVEQLAGDVADVKVLMSGGADPHSWQPSARDTQAVFEADLIVANGLDLEEGLASVLEQAETDGVPVLHAADFVSLRASADAEGDHAGEADDDHAASDPHFWLDPIAMRDVVLALDPVLAGAGIDLGDRSESLAADLESLDAELAEMLSVVPDDQRQLVTGHGALGYFADRYDFDIIGTVVPGLSSSDEPSARELATLIDAINGAGSTALFTDVGT